MRFFAGGMVRASRSRSSRYLSRASASSPHSAASASSIRVELGRYVSFRHSHASALAHDPARFVRSPP